MWFRRLSSPAICRSRPHLQLLSYARQTDVDTALLRITWTDIIKSPLFVLNDTRSCRSLHSRRRDQRVPQDLPVGVCHLDRQACVGSPQHSNQIAAPGWNATSPDATEWQHRYNALRVCLPRQVRVPCKECLGESPFAGGTLPCSPSSCGPPRATVSGRTTRRASQTSTPWRATPPRCSRARRAS